MFLVFYHSSSALTSALIIITNSKNSESCLKQLIKRNIFIKSYGFRPKKSEINPKKKFSLKFLLSSATLCSKISGFALTELSRFKNPPVQGLKSNYGRNFQKKLFSCENCRSLAPPNIRNFRFLPY